MSSSQLMSAAGVSASRSTFSTSEMSSWYGKRCPARNSASIDLIFSGSAYASSWCGVCSAISSALHRPQVLDVLGVTRGEILFFLLCKETLHFGQYLVLGLADGVGCAGEGDPPPR